MTKEQEMIERLRDEPDHPLSLDEIYKAAAMIEALVKERDGLKDDLEMERLRLAACGTAALGYFTSCAEEYRSASLDDVLRLYGQLAALRAKIDNAPVVAWANEFGKVWDRPAGIPLISKEELLK